MLFIGICGASGSGKSTLAEELATMVNKSILIINQDAYYKDHPDLSFEERCLLNYDEPSIFDHDQLLEGRRVSKKRYDYSHHCRADVPGEYLEPHDVIIVEGILIFQSQELRDIFDIKIFVEADADERILRRVLRDMNERGRKLDDIIEQYLTTVKPMHYLYVEPTKNVADIVINSGLNNVAFDIMKTKIEDILKKDAAADEAEKAW